MVSRNCCRAQASSTAGATRRDYIWSCANPSRNRHRAANWRRAHLRVTDRLRAPLTGRALERIRRARIAMLQPIYKNLAAPEASSLYCVWTTRDGNPGSPLVAVWIDSSMRAFEMESSQAAPAEAEEVSSDEPGSYPVSGAGARLVRRTKRTGPVQRGRRPRRKRRLVS